MKHALLIVDLQNDFLPGGALAVREGDQIIPVVNALIPQFDLVVATQDWHPANHGSFAANHGKEVGEVITLSGLSQFLWPIHCVQETKGAEFAAELNQNAIDRVFQKGMDQEVDSYSGFYDNNKRHSTGLTDFLRQEQVKDLTVVGLATDYCVKFTVLDALAEGFNTKVDLRACRGVEVAPGDCEKAIAEMKAAGAEMIYVDPSVPDGVS